MTHDYIALAIAAGQLKQTAPGGKWSNAIFVRTVNGEYTPPKAEPVKALPEPLPIAERIRLFHIGRGCCDGTDIDACAKARAAAETERTRKAKGRPREDDEYADTEPSEEFQSQIRAGSEFADMSLMCRNPIHRTGKHRMGDKCPDCNWTF